MDGLPVESVAEDERNVLRGAQVGEPVPGKHALHGDDQAVAKGGDGVQEDARVGGEVAMQESLAGGIENAQIHRPGVQVNAAVESVRVLIEAHHGLLAMGVGA
jgi:hypothetical protein